MMGTGDSGDSGDQSRPAQQSGTVSGRAIPEALAGDLASLHSGLRDLEGELRRAAMSPSTMVRPLIWEKMTDAEHNRHLADLAKWVQWLQATYAYRGLIPRCWQCHKFFHEELSALRLAWRGAYESAEATWDKPLAWHESFALSRLRIAEWRKEHCLTRHSDDAASEAASETKGDTEEDMSEVSSATGAVYHPDEFGVGSSQDSTNSRR